MCFNQKQIEQLIEAEEWFLKSTSKLIGSLKNPSEELKQLLAEYNINPTEWLRQLEKRVQESKDNIKLCMEMLKDL